MGDAYKVQALRCERLTAWTALHAATRGAAQALQLGDEIGGLSVGQTADLCVWDWATGPVAQARDAAARELHERVFAWMTLADERNLAACYVAGRGRLARG
jgi:guanine deaminase